MAETQKQVFQSIEIARLIQMPERRLAKFVESPGYGIAPSVRLGAGKGVARLYSLADLFSISIAWWLFQGGLRSKVIGRVLKSREVAKTVKDSEVWDEASAHRRFLLIKREMSSTESPSQEVLTGNLGEIMRIVEESRRYAFQVFPIGLLLFELRTRLAR